jgi:protein SCO1/2
MRAPTRKLGSRRQWLRRAALAAWPAAVWPLAGCDGLPAWLPGTKPRFNGIDITGADYGRNFKLQDPSGATRTLADYPGKVVTLFFGFTQCPDVCPTALAKAAEVKKALGKDAERLQVLFVTVDPERDTPEVMKAYAGAFDPSFVGLRTSLDETAKLAKDFRAYYAKVPLKGSASGYTIDHSAMTYVYDPKGQLRLAIRHEQTTEQIVADIRTLLKG